MAITGKVNIGPRPKCPLAALGDNSPVRKPALVRVLY